MPDSYFVSFVILDDAVRSFKTRGEFILAFLDLDKANIANNNDFLTGRFLLLFIHCGLRNTDAGLYSFVDFQDIRHTESDIIIKVVNSIFFLQ